jgi:hypothetical protein
MKPGGRGLNDSAIATASDPPLVDVRAPVGPDVESGTQAPTRPQRVHTIRGQSERTTVSSDSQSALNVELW